MQVIYNENNQNVPTVTKGEILETLENMDPEELWEDSLKCIECGTKGKFFDAKDCDIVWCPKCGRLYVMPFHVGLTAYPDVPEYTKERENEC